MLTKLARKIVSHFIEALTEFWCRTLTLISPKKKWRETHRSEISWKLLWKCIKSLLSLMLITRKCSQVILHTVTWTSQRTWMKLAKSWWAEMDLTIPPEKEPRKEEFSSTQQTQESLSIICSPLNNPAQSLSRVNSTLEFLKRFQLIQRTIRMNCRLEKHLLTRLTYKKLRLSLELQILLSAWRLTRPLSIWPWKQMEKLICTSIRTL